MLRLEEPTVTTTQSQPTASEQEHLPFKDPSNEPTISVSSPQIHQPFPTDIPQLSEQSSFSVKALLPNLELVLPQLEESQSLSLNPESEVLENPIKVESPQLELNDTDVSSFRSQQQQLTEVGNAFDVPTIQASNPQTQQPVQTISPSVTSETLIVCDISNSSGYRNTPLKEQTATTSQLESFGSSLQQLRFLVTEGPSPSSFSSQVEQVVCVSDRNSQNVLPQTETRRASLLETQLTVPSVTPSQFRSMDTISPIFGSPFLQPQSLTRDSSPNVPRALSFTPHLQQHACANVPESIPSLRKPLINVPNVRDIISRTNVFRHISIQPPLGIPEVSAYEPPIKKRRTDSSPQFNITEVSPSRPQPNITNVLAFGSALQQHHSFVDRSSVPKAGTMQSQLRQPVPTSDLQSSELSPPLRSLINQPHTTLPQLNEPRGTPFEPGMKVPYVMRSEPLSTVTDVPAFGFAQQQQLPFGGLAILPTAQTTHFHLQQPVHTYDSQMPEFIPSVRSMINVTHVVTIPRFNEPRDASFEPQLSVPNVNRYRPRYCVPNEPRFDPTPQQQQAPLFQSQSDISTTQSFRPQFQPQIPTYGPQLHQGSHSLVGSLTLPAPRLHSRITSTFGPHLQQRQSLSFESQLNVSTSQSFRPQLQSRDRVFASQLFRESHSSVGSLNLPTSQPKSKVTSMLGTTPLQQLEFLVSAPRPSDFNSQIEQLFRASDRQLYDRSPSLAGSLTDVSSIRHVTTSSEAPRDTLSVPQFQIPNVISSPPEFRPPSLQVPFLPLIAPLNVSRVPVVTSQSRQSVRAKRPQRKRSSTGSLVNVPNVGIVEPPADEPKSPLDHECRRREPFSIASLLGLPEVRTVGTQSEEPIDPSFEQQSNVPVALFSQTETQKPTSQRDVSKVRPSQYQSSSGDLPASRFLLQQQEFPPFGGVSNVQTAQTTHSQLRQQAHTSGSQLYEPSPSLRRFSSNLPNTVTTLPSSSEPKETLFESQSKVGKVILSQSQSSSANLPGFASTSQEQRSLPFGDPSNAPIARTTHSQLQQQVHTYEPQRSERSLLRRYLTKTPHTAVPQSREPTEARSNLDTSILRSTLESHLKVSNVTRSQTQSSVRNVPAFKSPLQQRQFLTLGDRSNVPTARTTHSQLRLPVHTYDSHLSERSSSLRISSINTPHTVTSEPIYTSFEPQLRISSVVSSRAQSTTTMVATLGSTLQQQQSLSLGSHSNVPTVRTTHSHSQEPIHSYGSRFSERSILRRSLTSVTHTVTLPRVSESKDTSIEPRLEVPNITRSQPQSTITNVTVAGSVVQQKQHLTFGSQPTVPTARKSHSQLQTPVHTNGSQYSERSILRRTLTSVTRTVTISSIGPRLEVPQITRSQPQSSITAIPGSGSIQQQQQQQNLTFGSQSTLRTTHSQLQPPVHTYGSQLSERSILRRSLTRVTRTVTLSRASESKDTSFEPRLELPDITRSQSQFTITNVPASGSVQQQRLTFGSQSTAPVARTSHSQLQRPVHTYGSQYSERSILRRTLTSVTRTVTLPRPIEPQIKVSSIVSSRAQSTITNVPAFGRDLQQQESPAFGDPSSLSSYQALIPQLQQPVRTRGSQSSYAVSSVFARDVLPPCEHPIDTLVEPKFRAPEPIPSQPPPEYATIQFDSPSQPQALIPFGNQSSVPSAQYITHPFQQSASLPELSFVTPTVSANLLRVNEPTVTSREPKMFVPRVPGVRLELSRLPNQLQQQQPPIALSLRFLDLPKVSAIGPRLEPHQDSAFRPVTLQSRTDTIFDVGNLRGAGLPELRNRRPDLRFGDLVHTPRRL